MVEITYHCTGCNTAKRVTYEHLYHNSTNIPRIRCCTQASIKGIVFQHSHEAGVTCGTKCAVATNSVCHCSCDGKNHGIAYRNFLPA